MVDVTWTPPTGITQHVAAHNTRTVSRVAERDAEVLKRHKDGESYSSIARSLGLDPKTVSLIVRRWLERVIVVDAAVIKLEIHERLMAMIREYEDAIFPSVSTDKNGATQLTRDGDGARVYLQAIAQLVALHQLQGPVQVQQVHLTVDGREALRQRLASLTASKSLTGGEGSNNQLPVAGGSSSAPTRVEILGEAEPAPTDR